MSDAEDEAWQADLPGLVELPGGRLVRGRSLRAEPVPLQTAHFGLVLLARRPREEGPHIRWVRWRDFALPADPDDAVSALTEALSRCAGERVEIACAGGRGRTGTALACLAVLDGLPADEAVEWVRRRYHPRAVETPWQRRFVGRFDAYRP